MSSIGKMTVVLNGTPSVWIGTNAAAREFLHLARMKDIPDAFREWREQRLCELVRDNQRLPIELSLYLAVDGRWRSVSYRFWIVGTQLNKSKWSVRLEKRDPK
jgi:hypothetical protein